MTHQERLKQLFTDLFQLDLADLDFGLYRLLNLKRVEVDSFLNEQLPKQVEEAFRGVTTADIHEIKALLDFVADEVRRNIDEEAILPTGELNPDFAHLKKCKEYESYRQQLLTITATEAEKADVFNHLYNFFSRYYDDADFIPKHFYGSRENYAVPYHGEEVYLHWANKDQHYIKTGEVFRDYTFNVETLNGQYRIRFALTDATVSKDNTKGETRFFFPLPDQATLDEATKEFRIPFEYRLPTEGEVAKYGTNAKGQDALLVDSLSKILKTIHEENLKAKLAEIVDKKEKEEISLLLRRLRHFTKKNTTDYFIHKNLKGFLERELEFYIKDQVVHLADIEGNLDNKRRMLRVLRTLAMQIITFLSQIEEVQKKLFEKKKFVLRADYLVPIQNVPRELWTKIVNNEMQVNEWKTLFDIQPQTSLFNEKGEVNEHFLEEHPTLVVNTAHFSNDFVERLLLSFDDIDEATDGLLIHSENYQALRLLENKFRESIDFIYIDPPYNTTEGSFVYKNKYKHSSWVAMMENRISIASQLLQRTGLIGIAIDDTESHRLHYVLDDLFNSNRVATLAIEVNPAGQNIRPNVPALSHDYCYIYAKDIDSSNMLLRELTEEEKDQYSEKDSKGYYLWDNLRRRGGNSRPKDRPKQWFPLYVSLSEAKVSIEPFEGCEEVWPIDPQGENRIWRVNKTGAEREIKQDEISVMEKAGRIEVIKKSRMPKGKKPKTLWKDSKYSATSHGTKLLNHIIPNAAFSYPKSLYLVQDCIKHWADEDKIIFDFFSGSGTTGHAVIDLNRIDDGNRKFILAEMGQYFDTVLLPRIQKITYTPEWKNGKPKRLATEEEAERTPRLVKILRLESYEDSLHNIVSDSTLAKAEPKAEAYKHTIGAEEYRMKYMIKLPLEVSDTMLNLEKLEHPFDYTIEILTDDGPREQKVDLIETFNYLLGVHVQRMERWVNDKDNRSYRVIKALDRDEKKRILILWRDMKDLNVKIERDFLESKLAEQSFDEVLINGDCATPGVHSLDGLFKRLMEEGEK